MVDQRDGSGKLSAIAHIAIRTLRLIRASIAGLANDFDTKQIAMSMVCLIFLLIVLAPTFIVVSFMYHIEYWKSYPPDFSGRMLIYIIRGSGDDFAQLTAFITPFFALLAGLKSRRREQSLFFSLFVCLSLLGAVGSLLSKNFVVAYDGQSLFEKPDWVGTNGLNIWSTQAKAFFASSFQTFLSFISILLGLRAAGS